MTLVYSGLLSPSTSLFCKLLYLHNIAWNYSPLLHSFKLSRATLRCYWKSQLCYGQQGCIFHLGFKIFYITVPLKHTLHIHCQHGQYLPNNLNRTIINIHFHSWVSPFSGNAYLFPGTTECFPCFVFQVEGLRKSIAESVIKNLASLFTMQLSCCLPPSHSHNIHWKGQACRYGMTTFAPSTSITFTNKWHFAYTD